MFLICSSTGGIFRSHMIKKRCNPLSVVKQSSVIREFKEEQARIFRHGFLLAKPTFRTGICGFSNDPLMITHVLHVHHDHHDHAFLPGHIYSIRVIYHRSPGWLYACLYRDRLSQWPYGSYANLSFQNQK